MKKEKKPRELLHDENEAFYFLYPSTFFLSTDTGRAMGCPSSAGDRILSADTLQRFTRLENGRSGGAGKAAGVVGYLLRACQHVLGRKFAPPSWSKLGA